MSDEIKARQRELSGQAQNELRPYRTPDDNAPEAWMATGVSVGLLGAGVLAASAVWGRHLSRSLRLPVWSASVSSNAGGDVNP